MGRQPPDRLAASTIPAPRPGRSARAALIGFACALFAALVALVGGLSILASTHAWLNGSAAAILIVAAFPFALAGLAFSIVGSGSRSRKKWAISGIILSVIALVPLAGLIVALFEFAAYCSSHSCY